VATNDEHGVAQAIRQFVLGQEEAVGAAAAGAGAAAGSGAGH
jgi:hypothetical protein